MADHDEGAARALSALREGTAARVLAGPAVLDLRGPDGPDLLHRLAASELRGLAAGRSAPVLLTTEKGRVLDLAQATAHDEGLWLLCGEARRAAVRDWIDRFTIMEELELREADEVASVALPGELALGRVADELSLERPAPRMASGALPGGLLLPDPAGHGGGTLLVEEARVEGLLAGARLVAAGPLPWRQWLCEQGRCHPGPALDGLRANPLELGFKGLVAFDKGCYVGQEVVARLDSYDKVRRRLARVSGEGEPPAPQDRLLRGDRATGELLEAVADLTRPGHWLGLALVPRDDEGGRPTLGDGRRVEVEAVG